VFAMADSMGPSGSDAGVPASIDTMLQAEAVPAQCGDLLVLRIRITSGTTGFIEFSTSLSVP
jgi:hypothetical protein